MVDGQAGANGFSARSRFQTDSRDQYDVGMEDKPHAQVVRRWLIFAVATFGAIAFAGATIFPPGGKKTVAICGIFGSAAAIAILLASDGQSTRSFSLKRFLAAIAFITVGIGSLVLPFKNTLTPTEVSIALWFLGGPLIGAGIGSLYKRPSSGAIAGAVLGIFLQGLAAFVIIKNKWLF
jgi:hypothetical protein